MAKSRRKFRAGREFVLISMNFVPPQDTTITVSMEPCPRLIELAAVWGELEGRSDGSFFTSWTWIHAWLSTFASDGALPRASLMTARAGSCVVGLAVIGEHDARSFLKRGHIAALHQSGVPADDTIFIEYNDFLMDRRFAEPTREAMLRFIAARHAAWCEVRLNGATPALAQAVTQSGLPHRVTRSHICPWVDLSRISPGLGGYLGVLSKNTRQQIQRSLRLYEQEGEVSLQPAAGETEALGFLDELADLHRRSWHDRKGHGGAFTSARFERFARALVMTGNANGSVQLLRASAGSASIGYLLNFAHQGHVYAYQSGFSYRDDNRYRPGLVTHALAVCHAREQGKLGYHFMAGDGRYKSSLANADEQLLWMTLRHDDLMSRAEDGARAFKARVKDFFQSVTG